MKKSILSTALFSVLVLGGIATTVKADTVDSAISHAKIIFKGSDISPNGPVDPENPDNPVDPHDSIDPDDPENHGTGDKGPLSIDYVSNISFGTQEIAQDKEVYTAINEDPYVQITDKRGMDGGWTLSATASKFLSNDSSELKGAILAFSNGQARSTSDNVSAAPKISDFTFDNNDAKTVMTAESLAGQGTWVDVFEGEEGNNSNIQLTVPAGSAQAKEYTATITWTLTAGPTDAQ